MRERRHKRANGRVPAGSSGGRAPEIPTVAKQSEQATVSQHTSSSMMFARTPMLIALVAVLLCSFSLVSWYGERSLAAVLNTVYSSSLSSTSASPKTTPSHDAPGDAKPSEAKKIRGPPRKGEVYRLKVVKRYPHDPNAYTQGLLYLGNNTLYESTGLHGRSTLRKVDLLTGRVLDVHRNARNDFGEGVAYYKGFFWQLLWKTRTVYKYDARTLQLISTHSMPKEFDFDDGWGLTSSSDGLSDLYAPGQLPGQDEALFATDSGTKLYHVQFRDGAFKLTKNVTIQTKQGANLEMANELEIIREDEVWANIYAKDCIARVNPHNGQIFGWILADHLRQEEHLGPRPEVFNGIAYDRNRNRIFVTGKLWSQLFEVRLVPEKMLTVEDVMDVCLPANNIFNP